MRFFFFFPPLFIPFSLLFLRRSVLLLYRAAKAVAVQGQQQQQQQTQQAKAPAWRGWWLRGLSLLSPPSSSAEAEEGGDGREGWQSGGRAQRVRRSRTFFAPLFMFWFWFRSFWGVSFRWIWFWWCSWSLLFAVCVLDLFFFWEVVLVGFGLVLVLGSGGSSSNLSALNHLLDGFSSSSWFLKLCLISSIWEASWPWPVRALRFRFFFHPKFLIFFFHLAFDDPINNGKSIPFSPRIARWFVSRFQRSKSRDLSFGFSPEKKSCEILFFFSGLISFDAWFWRVFLVLPSFCRRTYRWRRCSSTCDAIARASPPPMPSSASTSSAPTGSRRRR